MLLVPDEVLDPLPAQVGLALLYHHQVAEDQEEAVARDIKSFPIISTCQAGLFSVVLGDITHPWLLLQQVEHAGEAEPGPCRDAQPHQVVPDDVEPPAAVGVAGEIHERPNNEQSPEPAQLNKPLVQEIVWVCPEASGRRAWFVITDNTDHENTENIDTDSVGDIKAIDNLPADVDKHHQNNLQHKQSIRMVQGVLDASDCLALVWFG